MLAFYARGNSTRDIRAMLEELYGIDVSAATNGFSCAESDGAALLASRYTGLHILDGSFDEVANITNGGFSMKLHLDGDQVYVADLSGGVRIYDLTDP